MNKNYENISIIKKIILWNKLKLWQKILKIEWIKK